MTTLETIHPAKPATSDDLKSGTLLQLAPRMAVDREKYLALSAVERQRLECIAIARSSYTAVLISKSAALLHDLWLLPCPEDPVELALPCGSLPRHNRHAPGRRYRKTTVGDVETIDGARVVSIARAVADVARYHGFRHGLIAADSALNMGISPAQLQAEVDDLGRVHNAAAARKAIACASSLSRSPFESLVRALAVELGLDAKPRQRVAPGIEALLIEESIIVEIGPQAVLSRRSSRTAYLRSLGYRVVQFTPEQLAKDPDTCRRTLHMVAQAHAAKAS